MKSTLANVVTTETDVPFGRDNQPVVAVVVETDVRLETKCREWLIRVYYERPLVRSSFEGVQVRNSLVPLILRRLCVLQIRAYRLSRFRY